MNERAEASVLDPWACRTASLAILVALTGVDIVWLSVASVSVDLNSTVFGLSVATVLTLYGLFYTFVRASERIAGMSFDAAILILFSHAGCVFGYLVATSPLPLQDEWLAAVDRALGFDWLAYYRAVFASEPLRLLFIVFYDATLPLVVLTTVWLALRGFVHRSSEFVLSIIVGAVLCIGISWFLPAVGAIGFFAPDEAIYAGRPILVDLEYKQDYFRLRAGEPVELSFAAPKGLVAFPSYHVCMAVLAVVAFRGHGAMFWAMMLVNAMTIATVPVNGGHHLTDALGGAIVAGISFAIARGLSRRRSGIAVSRRLAFAERLRVRPSR